VKKSNGKEAWGSPIKFCKREETRSNADNDTEDNWQKGMLKKLTGRISSSGEITHEPDMVMERGRMSGQKRKK